jgi:hypothetical protein
MGTKLQEVPHAIREMPSYELNVGMSRTISAQKIRGTRICSETKFRILHTINSVNFRRVRTAPKNAYYLHFRPSVRPSYRMYQCGSHSKDFVKFGTRRFLWKTVEKKIAIWLNSDKNVGHFTWRSNYVLLFLATINRHKSSLEWNCTRLLGKTRGINTGRTHHNVTLNVYYLSCLKWLHRKKSYRHFIQATDTAHTVNNCVNMLGKVSGDRLLYQKRWSAPSRDLNPGDLYLWGTLKNIQQVNDFRIFIKALKVFVRTFRLFQDNFAMCLKLLFLQDVMSIFRNSSPNEDRSYVREKIGRRKIGYCCFAMLTVCRNTVRTKTRGELYNLRLG